MTSSQQDRKVIVRQVRSANRRTNRIKATLSALGLGRIGNERVHLLSPSVYGMLRQVRHLIEVNDFE